MAAPASKAPRVRVAAAIPIGSSLLLVRQHKADRSYWLLPGGGVSWGESLAQALVREVQEEIGLQIAVDRLLFISDTIAPDGSKHVVNVTFLAHAVSSADEAAPRDPAIDAVDLVPVDQLGQLDLRPPIAAELAAFFTERTLSAAYLGPRWVAEGSSSTDPRPESSQDAHALHKPVKNARTCPGEEVVP